MKAVLKVLLAFFIAVAWFLLSQGQAKEVSIAFFFIILFVLFIKPKSKDSSPIQEQYFEKMQENIKKSQEINKKLKREKNVVYRDIRRRRKDD